MTFVIKIRILKYHLINHLSASLVTKSELQEKKRLIEDNPYQIVQSPTPYT